MESVRINILDFQKELVNICLHKDTKAVRCAEVQGQVWCPVLWNMETIMWNLSVPKYENDF